PDGIFIHQENDYAGVHGDGKSTTDGCQFLGRRLISWQCKKQTFVATSSCKAEYVAATSCCGQRTKHIEIQHHFIRDANEKKLIQVLKIPTEHNVADLLTKCFDVTRFGYLVVHVVVSGHFCWSCDFLLSEFEMSSMGPLTFFLGLQVDQRPDGIFIHQEKYVADILKKFDLGTSKLASTPFEPQKIREKNVPDEPISVHLYRSMIGCLMYLTATRPDIMFAVCAAARHQVTPKTSNLLSVKRIFKYLTAYPKLGLWYPRDSPFDLEAFSDNDYAGAHGDRKSTTGGCQFLRRRLISWQCKKQTIVVASSCEVEYVAAASCCGQLFLVTSAGRVIFCWLIVIPAGDLTWKDVRGLTDDQLQNVYNKIRRVVDLATAKDHHQQLKRSGKTLESSESKKLKSSHNTEQSAELPNTTSVSAGATLAAGDPISDVPSISVVHSVSAVPSVSAAFSIPAETPIAAGVSITVGVSESAGVASVPIIDLLDSPPKAISLPLDLASRTGHTFEEIFKEEIHGQNENFA
nr:putative ribonuclease H-like domain-containing protein [Tanacetum cinerariifolium]